MIAIDTSRIDELTAARQAAPAERVAAEGRFAQATTAYEAARLAFQATRARAELGHLPQSAVTQAERALKSARTELDAAEDALGIAAEKAMIIMKALDAEHRKLRDSAAPKFRAEGARIAKEIVAHLDALVSLGEQARSLESALNEHMAIATTNVGGRVFGRSVEPVAATLGFLRSQELKALFRRWQNAPGAAALAEE